MTISGLQIEYVIKEDDAVAILTRIAQINEVHAIDFETTSLYPSAGRVRLSNIAGPVCEERGVDAIVIDHDKSIDFYDCALLMAKTPWACFNVLFEGRWFDYNTDGDRLVDLRDVGLMSKAKLGGRPLSFKQQVLRDLEIELEKDEQNSDWSAPDLTPEQIDYAGKDGFYTYALYEKWAAILEEDGLEEGFWTLNDAWRGTAAMEDAGFPIDVDYHKKLIRMWTLRRDAAEAALRRFTPPSLIENLRSKKQLSDFLKTVFDADTIEGWPLAGSGKAGQLDLTRATLRQASYRAPYPLSRWLAALMVFNRADKYLGTYGDKLVNIMELRGAIFARFNIAQAITGRYSSSEPNLQNIPRSQLVRRSFTAPMGEVLVLADYSGIELRVLAEISDDDQLRHDVIYGDVHGENAALIFDLDRDAFFAALAAKDPRAKEMRAKAKAFSFQLTYGAGNGALALVLRCSDDAAAEHVMKWAARYPKAYGFRQTMFERMRHTGFLPAGARTIYVPRDGRTMPVASNYPIQGAAANVMYRAVYHMDDYFYRNRKLLTPRSTIVAAVHDELLSKTLPKYADHVHEAQRTLMTRAWLDVFPGSSTDNLLESAIGDNWAAKP